MKNKIIQLGKKMLDIESTVAGVKKELEALKDTCGEISCKTCTGCVLPNKNFGFYDKYSVMGCTKMGQNSSNFSVRSCEEFRESPNPVKESLRWRAKPHGAFYRLTEDGEIVKEIDHHTPFDDWQYKTNNYHETEKKCKDKREAVEIQIELESLAHYISPWPTGITVWSLIYDRNTRKHIVTSSKFGEPSIYGFRTMNGAEDARNRVDEDRLKFMRDQGLKV